MILTLQFLLPHTNITDLGLMLQLSTYIQHQSTLKSNGCGHSSVYTPFHPMQPHGTHATSAPPNEQQVMLHYNTYRILQLFGICTPHSSITTPSRFTDEPTLYSQANWQSSLGLFCFRQGSPPPPQ